MTHRKSKPLKAASPAGGGAGAFLAERQSATSPKSIPILIWLVLCACIVSFMAIVLAMTPLTHNLDDIKIPLFLTLGPSLMLIALAVIYLGAAPLPPRFVGFGLAGFGVIMFLSTLAANPNYRYLGWYQIMFVWSAAGFFMAGLCIGSNWLASRWFLNFMVLQLLLVNLIGFFFFDFTNSPDPHSGGAWLFRMLYGDGQPDPVPALYNLLYTLVHAAGDLQSTILNRDFYAGYCILFLPFALLLALDPGKGRPLLWRTIGLVTVMIDSLSIFFCKSKGEWIFAVVSCLFFAVLFLRVGRMPGLRRRHLAAWAVGLMFVLGMVGWLQSPTLLIQLKSMQSSFSARGIIWNGAWQIFLNHPILGGGPGTFRIYFPEFRSPDYFNNGINNVTTYAHNYFLDLLSEEGALGFLCFMVFLCALVIQGTRYALRHQDPRLRLWLTAAVASMIAIYGSNLSSPNARWVIGATPLWTVMGYLAGLIRQAQGWTAEQGHPQPVRAGASPVRNPAVGMPGLDQKRRIFVLATALLGFVVMYFSVQMGTSYFKSAKEYAQGMQLMDWAYPQLEAGQTEASKVIDWMERSAKFFEDAIEIDDTNVSAYYKLGSIYTTLNSLYQNVARDLAQKGHEQEAENYLTRADEYLKNAKASYETLGQYDPDYAEIHFNFGIVYQIYADYLRRSAEERERAAKDYGGKPADMPREYERRGLEHLDRMGKLSIKPEVATQLGNYYNSMQYFDRGRDTFRDASRRYPGDRDLALAFYKTALKVKDYPAACEALKRLWDGAPAEDTWLDQLLSLSMTNHLDDLVQQVIVKLEKINPINPRLYEARIYLASRQGKTEQVLEATRHYIQCGGQDLDLYQRGIDAGRLLGLEDQSREIARLLLTLDRDGKSTYSQQAHKLLAPPNAGGNAKPAAGNTSNRETSTPQPLLHN